MVKHTNPERFSLTEVPKPFHICLRLDAGKVTLKPVCSKYKLNKHCHKAALQS